MENKERSVKIIFIMENLEIILIIVVGNVGTLFMEEYFCHEAKFEIWHGKVTCGLLHVEKVLGKTFLVEKKLLL